MRKSEESSKGFKETFTSLILFCITGITLSLLLTVLGALLVLTESLPVNFIQPFCAFSVFVGSLITSILSCKKLGKPLFTALSSSILFISVLFIAGALLYGRALPEVTFIYILAATILGSLLGAIISAGRKQRKTRKK